jgi:hypothetical protein
MTISLCHGNLVEPGHFQDLRSAALRDRVGAQNKKTLIGDKSAQIPFEFAKPLPLMVPYPGAVTRQP